MRRLAAFQGLFVFDALRRLFRTARSLDALEVKKLIEKTPGIVLLDVRKDGEYRPLVGQSRAGPIGSQERRGARSVPSGVRANPRQAALAIGACAESLMSRFHRRLGRARAREHPIRGQA